MRSGQDDSWSDQSVWLLLAVTARSTLPHKVCTNPISLSASKVNVRAVFMKIVYRGTD